MRRAVCPGSFDPVTNGHVDVIIRAAALYDELVVAVLVNPGKAGLFTVDERMELLRDAISELPNVTVDSFEGLLVDYCRAHDIPVIVKGLRAVSDFEYELQMAQMNRELAAVGLPGGRVVAGSVPTVVRGAPSGAFDLVLADPPYATPAEDSTNTTLSAPRDNASRPSAPEPA